MCKDKPPAPDWKPEPFPEPRTMPENWHAEALKSKKSATQTAPADDWKPEPFPEPRAFPWHSDQ